MVSVPGIDMVWWWWTADGQHLVVFGNEPGSPNRHFIVPIDNSAAPRAITPPGSAWAIALSPDSTNVAFVGAPRKLSIAPIAGGEPRPVAGSERGDLPVQWSDDGAALFVCKAGRLQTSIDRLELATGNRSPWQHLRPADPAGIQDLMPIFITADGSRYAYGYRRFLSDLYVASGLL